MGVRPRRLRPFREMGIGIDDFKLVEAELAPDYAARAWNVRLFND